MKALIHTATWQEESPFQQWEGGRGCQFQGLIPKDFLFPFFYSSVVVLPAFLAVKWRPVSLSVTIHTNTHTLIQALEYRDWVHSQHPMELYIFCNLICMPALLPVLWMGEEDAQARNLLHVAEFSLEKPVIASLERGDTNYSMKMVIASCFLQM